MNQKEKISIVSDNHGSLIITLLRKTNYFILFLTGIWLVMWAGITLTILYGMAVDPDKINGELPFFTFLILLAGMFVLKSFLWHLQGKERIELNDQELVITKLGTILTSIKRYELSQIDNFRLTEQHTSPWVLRLYGFTGGEVEFDYYGNKKSFAQTINKKEAQTIVNILNQKSFSPLNKVGPQL